MHNIVHIEDRKAPVTDMSRYIKPKAEIIRDLSMAMTQGMMSTISTAMMYNILTGKDDDQG